MWRKIFKCRELVKKLYRVEVKNGKRILFWYERWFFFGCLKDILSVGSYIDMGILVNVIVEDSWKYNKRNYRVLILNRVEEEIARSKVNRT